MTRIDLGDGFIDIEKQTKNDEINLCFRAQLEVKFPAKEIWEQLDFAFSGREKAWFWPYKYSRSIAIDDVLKSAGKIRTTYSFPSIKDPSAPPKESTYTYDMLVWEPQEMTFQYHTIGDDHPFRGGATVLVESNSDNTCILHWDGVYKMAANFNKVADHFSWYFPTFIKDLQKLAEERNKSSG